MRAALEMNTSAVATSFPSNASSSTPSSTARPAKDDAADMPVNPPFFTGSGRSVTKRRAPSMTILAAEVSLIAKSWLPVPPLQSTRTRLSGWLKMVTRLGSNATWSTSSTWTRSFNTRGSAR